jgi:hypothetical protein
MNEEREEIEARMLAIEGLFSGLTATLIARGVLHAEDVIEHLAEVATEFRKLNHHAAYIGVYERARMALRADFPKPRDEDED